MSKQYIADKFTVTSGLGTQFLKGDGTLDSKTYLTGETDTIATVSGRASGTTNQIGAAKFVTNGGTASQFVKGDGTLDSNTYTTNLGTVTSVSVVSTNGFTGSVANATTTPAITLTLQTANTGQSGQLSSTDWNTFNNKANTATTVSVAGGALTGGGNLNANMTITLPQATGAVNGYLASGDWTTFNNKQNAIGYTPANTATTVTASAPLTGGGNLGSNFSIGITQATTSTNGYLSSIDWNTFNGKQAALNGTGFVKMAGTVVSYDNTAYYPATNPNGYASGTVTSFIYTNGNGFTGVVTNASSTPTLSLTLQNATSGQSGQLTSADWNTFNNKANTATTVSVTGGGLTGGGNLNANFSVGLTQATSTTLGWLSSADWNTFFGKQNALTNPITGNGAGVANQVAIYTGANAINGVTTKTAFNVDFEASTANIKMDGAVSVGVLGTAARADHVHPTDTSRAQDTLVVHLAGSETITGLKTFNTALPQSSLVPASGLDLVNKAYADGLVVGLIDDRGNWNAATGNYPNTGGSGAAGAILKGDLWYIATGGTIQGQVFGVGDSVRAMVDSPGQTPANWATMEANVGYVPANQLIQINTTAPLTGGGDLSANRTIAMPKATGAVDGYLAATDFASFAAKVSFPANGVTGSGTQNKLTKWSATASNIVDSSVTDTGALVTSSVPVSVTGTMTATGQIASNTSIKMGDDASAASAGNVGSLKYYVVGNNSYVDMCMQTGAGTYAWVNILQNNW